MRRSAARHYGHPQAPRGDGPSGFPAAPTDAETGDGWKRKSLTVPARPRTVVPAMTTAAKKTTAPGVSNARPADGPRRPLDGLHREQPETAELAALTGVIGGLRTPEMAHGSHSRRQGLGPIPTPF